VVDKCGNSLAVISNIKHIFILESFFIIINIISDTVFLYKYFCSTFFVKICIKLYFLLNIYLLSFLIFNNSILFSNISILF